MKQLSFKAKYSQPTTTRASIVKYTKLLLSLSLIPCFAQANQQPVAGFSGEISILTGIVSTNSNLSTEGDSTKYSPLNSEGNREHDFLIGGLAELNYTFGHNLEHQIFFGTSRDDVAVGVVALEAGYKYTLPSGTAVSFSYLPTLVSKDIWQDPYKLDSARAETEMKGSAYRLKIEDIDGMPLSVNVAYAKTEVDTELSGEALGLSTLERSQLARSGNSYYSKVSYRQMLGRGVGITPSLAYQKFNADGTAMRYDGYGAEMSFFNFAGRNKIILTAKYTQKHYDGNNPIFDTRRKDKDLSLFTAYEFSEFMDIPSVSLFSLLGYDKVSSNIDFYSYSQYLLSIGLTYRF